MSEPSSVARLRGGLIVSCQAPDDSPLRDPAIMAVMAQAAELGGAIGLRVNGVEDIRAIRAVTTLPIIGLAKVQGPRRLFITPRIDLAEALIDAGADVVAVDATVEMGGAALEQLGEILARINAPVMADVSTLEEGIQAAEMGAAVIGTTLSGYTPYSRAVIGGGPDLALVEQLAGHGLLVFAEGRYRSVEDVADAFSHGAGSVVVGGAITNPVETTGRFAAAARSGR